MKQPYLKVYITGTGRDISHLIGHMYYDGSVSKDNEIQFSLYPDANILSGKDKDIVANRLLSFQWGYGGGGLSRVHLARITDIEATYSKVNSPTYIQLTCADKGTLMKKGTNNRVWKKMTSLDIVKAIADEYSMQLITDEFPKYSPRYYESIPQGNRSDFQFIRHLASKEGKGDYMFYCTNNEIHYRLRDLSGKSSWIFTHGKDIISFSTRFTEQHISKEESEAVDNLTPYERKVSEAQKQNMDAMTALGGDFIFNDFSDSAGKTFSELKDNNYYLDSEDPNDIDKITKLAATERKLEFQSRYRPATEEEQAKIDAGEMHLDGVDVIGSVPYIEEDGGYGSYSRRIAINAKYDILNSDFRRQGHIYKKEVHKYYVRKNVSPDAKNADALSNFSADIKTRKVLTGMLVLEGNPNLVEGSIITIQNVMAIHEGNWFVESVVHTLGDGKEYISELKLYRNASEVPTTTVYNQVDPSKVNKAAGKNKPESLASQSFDIRVNPDNEAEFVHKVRPDGTVVNSYLDPSKFSDELPIDAPRKVEPKKRLDIELPKKPARRH